MGISPQNNVILQTCPLDKINILKNLQTIDGVKGSMITTTQIMFKIKISIHVK